MTQKRWSFSGWLARLWRRRVPVMLQMSAVECGSACLAMVLNYHGRKVSLMDTHLACGAGRDGVNAGILARAARAFGLRVKAVSVGPENFQHVQLPAIAHWNFNHFVVVERWSPAWVDVVDPALGRRRLPAQEFGASLTGVVLILEPGPQFERRAAAGRLSWRLYLGYILRMPGVLAQILAVSLLLQIFGLALPVFTKILVDNHHALPLQFSSLITVLGIGAVLLVLNQLVAGYLRAILLLHLQARLDTQMMLGFFEHLLSLPFRFFQQRNSGDLLMRFAGNSVIRDTLTSQTISIVLDGVLVLVYLAILLAQDLRFGLIVLGLGLLQVGLLLATTGMVYRLTQQDLVTQSETHSYVVEALRGIETLKASGAEARVLERWSNLFFKQLNVSLQRSHTSAAVDTVMNVLRTFSPLVLLWAGIQWVMDGSMTLGSMLALTALAGSFLAPLVALMSNAQRLQLAGAHLERLADVLQNESEQDRRSVQAAPQLSGRIELRRLSFRYDEHAPLVLEDISLTILPGQKVGIVGRTGSGKSTLAKLLLGLYDPTQGEILYDDRALQSLDYLTLRSQLGVVLQDAFLFSGSMRMNIAFNNPELSLAQIQQAAQLATLDAEITRLPMGYETPIAEGGSVLSGGQRQRLALARAVAHAPAVLVLDEATSHLDAVTEAQISQSLSRLACTQIVIAHRLSTIRDADLILVLEAGRIVEHGTHEDLLAQGGQYAALVHNQLGHRPTPAGTPTSVDLPV